MNFLLQLLCLSCWFLLAASEPGSHAELLAGVVYDPRNIVDNVNNCPVKNVYFDPKTEFDYKASARFQAVLRDQNVSRACYDATISSLARCIDRKDFAIKYGCCSQACTQGFQKALDSNCTKEYRLAACRDPRGPPLVLVGDVILKRCLNFTELSCEEAVVAYDGVLGPREGPDSSSTSSTPSAVGGGSNIAAAPAAAPAATPLSGATPGASRSSSSSCKASAANWAATALNAAALLALFL